MLDAFGIGIDSSDNGVFLPRNLASANPDGIAVHAVIHTSAYYQRLNTLLSAATSREEALGILSMIRNELLGH